MGRLLFGLPGVILATPVMVVAKVLAQPLYVEGLLEAEDDESEATRRSEPGERP